jgi:hemoglobin
MGRGSLPGRGARERHTMTASIYERIGGEDAIVAAATLFYEKVLSDTRLSPFFANLDMDQQVRKQVAFMSWAFGGPERYQYRGLAEAHAKLRPALTHAHFDAILLHLQSTLNELGVDHALTDEVLQVVESTRARVLGD